MPGRDSAAGWTRARDCLLVHIGRDEESSQWRERRAAVERTAELRLIHSLAFFSFDLLAKCS